jgi:UDP-N-acetylmuramoylalanine--D-glutamate ligase
MTVPGAGSSGTKPPASSPTGGPAFPGSFASGAASGGAGPRIAAAPPRAVGAPIRPRSVEGLGVAVLGLGRSGRAAARLALARGAAWVHASDTSDAEPQRAAAAELAGLGARVELGRHDGAVLARADVVVLSPGIPAARTPLAGLPSARVVGELELASWYLRSPCAAVTGTNGKTTTTAWLAAMGEAAGLVTPAAGNIGRPLSDVALEADAPDWIACEASSFQLAATESFHPRVAVLTNLAPDHLDRYATFAEYVADKEAVARNLEPGDALVVNGDDPASGTFAPRSRAARHVFTTGRPAGPGIGVVRGTITQLEAGGGEVRIAPAAVVSLPGPHNLQNGLAAALAARLLGVPPDAVAHALAAFRGVPHRLEEVARVDGVRFVNDSKATNVEAAIRALRSFDGPLHLILGGRHKGSPYTPLLREMAGKVRAVYAIGEAADRIARELGGEVPVRRPGTLERAVEEAFRAAAGGDTVLLSPACSSYDQFTDYEARGEAFRRLAASLRSSPAFARERRGRATPAVGGGGADAS